MKELLIRLVFGLAVSVVVVIAVTWVAGDDLIEPTNRDIQIGRPPLDLEASNITFASGSGALIHGWLSTGKPGQGAVMLLHGLRGDRREMVSRAQFLRARGYSVLLFDFQGHGESRGSRITFGDLESRDVTAAIQYLHHKLPNEQVGVIGATLGAAAFVLAEQRPAVAAVVLEQTYPTIQQAVAGRARRYLGPLAPVFAPLLLAQVQARIAIPANRLRPVDHIAQIGAPVLIVNGTQDNYTSIDDARALLAAASDPKQLWAVQGAGHVDLYAFAKAQYQQQVGDFLDRYMTRLDAHH